MTNVLYTDGLWIRVDSALRVGAGEKGAVDLTIARETHTGWPFVPAPTLKGLLRAHLENLEATGDAPLSADLAFGTQENGGLIACGDARIAALTVRSLIGVMAWVTCPSVVQRLARDLMLSDLSAPDHVEPISGDAALCRLQSPLVDRNALFLEGLAFVRSGDLPSGASDVLQVCSASFGLGFDAADRLVVVSDRAFGFLARHSLPVVARVRLEYETKTAASGALFSQESVPPDTIFCSTVWCDSASGRRRNDRDVDAARAWVASLNGAPGQVGSGASVGMGICEVSVMRR